jgi:hypothetical protein
MSDLRERLQELADVAARQGRVPGPRAAMRRARRRRLLAGGTAAVVAVAFVAAVVGLDRVAGRAPYPPTATTAPATNMPSTVTASTGPPDVSSAPGPRRVERPAGTPSGKNGKQMVHTVAGMVARCNGGGHDQPTVLVAWGRVYNQTWLIAAAPPRPGEKGFCWAHGLFNAGGGGGGGSNGSLPVTDLQASGSDNIRSRDGYWGFVTGPVTKRATRVQVRFDMGIPPLDLTPIPTDDRFPVNFYAGAYRQPAKDRRPATWQVTGVVAYDQAGNEVAACRFGGDPAHTC